MAVTTGRRQADCQKPGASGAAATETEFAVVAIDQILDGSLLSKERLLQAREHYTPSGALPPEQAFARWTQRISVQAELGSAREIAGLSEEELAAMEAEFMRCPVRPRSATAGFNTGVTDSHPIRTATETRDGCYNRAEAS